MQLLQDFYDNKILPLYRDVVKAKSTKSVYDSPEEVENFVIVKKIRETNLYRLEKAYHKPSAMANKAIERQNPNSIHKSWSTKSTPCTLKRYHASTLSGLELEHKSSRAFYGSNYVAENERRVMEKLKDCVFIHTLIDVLTTQEVTENFEVLKETWLKFEYSSLGSLAELIESKGDGFTPTLQQVSSFASQMIAALGFIHSKKIVHGELTSKNILFFAPGILKLSNFALSVDLSTTDIENLPSSGPLFYTAPEKLRRMSAEQRGDEAFLTIDYNEKADIWSFGIIMLELFLRVPPLHRACSEDAGDQEKFMLFLTDLASPQRCKGSALYHLFYPHYDLVRHQVENDEPLDMDLLKKNMPQLNKSPEDALIVLMGFKEDKVRYTKPNSKDSTILPRFKKLWMVSSYFDFVRQCLFLPFDQRPSAEELEFHAFVNKSLRELREVQHELPEIIERFKTREGKKSVWVEYKLGLSIAQIFSWIKDIEAKTPL